MSQLWSTSYGRVILVKSGLLLVLVVLGWVNRRRLAGGFARLRPVTLVELLVLLVVVGAVGTLTDLRPGAARATTPEATPTATAAAARRHAAAAPPPGAYVDAAQAGRLAVGFAFQDDRAIVTLTNGAGNGVADESVTIDGQPGQDCGRGCFTRRRCATATWRSTSAARRSASPSRRPCARRPPRSNKLRRDYDALKSVVIDERLASGPVQPAWCRASARRRPAAWPTSSSAARTRSSSGRRGS